MQVFDDDKEDSDLIGECMFKLEEFCGAIGKTWKKIYFGKKEDKDDKEPPKVGKVLIRHEFVPTSIPLMNAPPEKVAPPPITFIKDGKPAKHRTSKATHPPFYISDQYPFYDKDGRPMIYDKDGKLVPFDNRRPADDRWPDDNDRRPAAQRQETSPPRPTYVKAEHRPQYAQYPQQ